MMKKILLLMMITALVFSCKTKQPLTSTRALETVNVGTVANDGTGDPLRTAFQKVNAAIEVMNDVSLDQATGSTGTGNLVFSASPTLTGTVTLPSATSIGDVSSTEIGYVDNVTSNIQTQLNSKVNVIDTSSMLAPYILDSKVQSDINDTITARLAGGTVGIRRADSLTFYNNYDEASYFDVLKELGSTVVAGTFGVTPNNMSSNSDLTDGTIYVSLIRLRKEYTIAGVSWFQRTAGDYTADEYNGIGLYSLLGTTITKITETVNDGNIWKTSSYSYGSKAFPSPQTIGPGIYFVAMLYNSSAQVTAPNIYAPPATHTNFNDITGTAVIPFSYKTGQIALPASQAFSGLTESRNITYVMLYE